MHFNMFNRNKITLWGVPKNDKLAVATVVLKGILETEANNRIATIGADYLREAAQLEGKEFLNYSKRVIQHLNMIRG